MNKEKVEKLGTWLVVCNFVSKLLHDCKKYGGFLLNCLKTSRVDLIWKYRLWVDFEIESVFSIIISAGQKGK